LEGNVKKNVHDVPKGVMAATGNEPPSAVVQIDTESFKRLRDGIGTLLLDNQASTAIVFTSALEEHLRIALAAKMPNTNSRVEKILFEGYGPLATFRSKIDVAFALGIFTDKQTKDAHNIRRVRNKFAHTAKKLNFETPTVIALCKKLSTYDSKETKLMNTYVKAIDELVEHLNKEFKTSVMVRALRDKADQGRYSN
jgi:DNA-binding MltR family transcriptional regulator